jgi:hypothetical protein
MSNHRVAAIAGLTGVIAIVAAAVWVARVRAVGQPTTAAKTWSAPRLAWGDPDLQGVWTVWDPTPMQARTPRRPGRSAAADADPADGNQGDADQSDADQDKAKYDALFGGADGKGTNEGLGGGMSRIHFGPVSPKRRALVVDPPDGQIPIIKANVRRQHLRDMWDTWEAHSAWERCITKGMPGRLLEGGTGGYDRSYQILQSPGVVAIMPEEIHDTRIVPVDGRPHVNSTIRLWNGDSRGRWEGQTLVVETTNFNNGGDGFAGSHQTETLRLVERFTRIDPNTLDYQVTFEDPNMYTRSWTARQPHNLDPKYVIYEYACHEGNTNYMAGSLKQGRVVDAEEAAAKKNHKDTAQP